MKQTNKNLLEDDWVKTIGQICEIVLKSIYLITKEIFVSVYRRTFPFLKVGIGLLWMLLFLNYHWDLGFFKLFGLASWYPKNPALYKAYYYFWLTCPIWGWGLFRVATNRHLTNRVDDMSQSIGLKNGSGRTPKPVFDLPNKDGVTRTLRLNRNGISIQDFQKTKSSIEGAMNAYVGDIRENRNQGTIDIVYSKEPLTDYYEIPSLWGWEQIQILMTEKEMVQSILNEANKIFESQTPKIELEKLKKKQQAVQAQIEALAEHLAKIPKDVSPAPIFDQMKKLEELKNELTIKARSFEQEQGLTHPPASFKDFESLLTAMKTLLSFDSKAETKSKIAQKLIQSVEVFPDKVRIHFKVGKSVVLGGARSLEVDQGLLKTTPQKNLLDGSKRFDNGWGARIRT